MKKFLFIVLLFIGLFSNAQSTFKSINGVPITFTYSYGWQNGTFTVLFRNQPYGVVGVRGTIGTSNDILGSFSFSCEENYNDFWMKLWNYGQTTAHWTGDRSFVPCVNGQIEFVLEPRHPLELIIDPLGRVWRLTKPQAVALAEIFLPMEKRILIPNCSCPLMRRN